jgi:hypothetical protein
MKKYSGNPEIIVAKKAGILKRCCKENSFTCLPANIVLVTM